MGSYFFLANLLPPMPAELGDEFSVSFADISLIIKRNIEYDDVPLVDLSLMFVDTRNFESHLQGWDIFLPGGTLSRDQLSQERELPFFMRAFLAENERRERRGYVYDGLWERYFAYSYSLAAEMGCSFLVGYLSWEIRLRNSLAALRARGTGEDAQNYQMLPWVGSLNLTPILHELNPEKGPVSIEKFLDQERLKSIYEHEGVDPFSRNAILAYLERSRIFSRWYGVYESFDLENIIASGG